MSSAGNGTLFDSDKKKKQCVPRPIQIRAARWLDQNWKMIEQEQFTVAQVKVRLFAETEIDYPVNGLRALAVDSGYSWPSSRKATGKKADRVRVLAKYTRSVLQVVDRIIEALDMKNAWDGIPPIDRAKLDLFCKGNAVSPPAPASNGTSAVNGTAGSETS